MAKEMLDRRDRGPAARRLESTGLVLYDPCSMGTGDCRKCSKSQSNGNNRELLQVTA
jgi:hypothetical protein